jgi:hypothetical protein
MKLLTVPAARGVQWMRGGFRVFMKQPLACTLLFMAFLFSLMVLTGLPGFGALLGLALVPATNVGFVLASQGIEAGRTPSPALLVAALRGPRQRVVAMLQIGLAYALCALLAKWLCDLLDPGFSARLQDFLTPADPAQPAPPDAALQRGMLLRLLLPLPFTLLFWHAPVIVYHSGMGAAKAVFASALACWRNLPAFAVYLLSWAVLVAVGGLLAVGLPALLGQPPGTAVVLTVPVALMFCTAFYASLYFTVADCFHFDPEAQPQ